MEICTSLIEHFHLTFGCTRHFASLPPPTPEQRLFQWLKVVIPDYKATQFTPEDWRDGKLLASLLEYVTGIQHSKNNLADIIEEVECSLGIPPILKPSDLSTSHGTFILFVYLYFFAKPNSPGQRKLLEWVNSLPPWKDRAVKDFQLERWATEHGVYEVVDCLFPKLMPPLATVSSLNTVQITQQAVTAVERSFSISPSFPAAAMCSPATDSFPLILFLSQLQSTKSILPNSEPLIEIKGVKSLYAVGSNISIELESSNVGLEATVQSQFPEEKVLLHCKEGARKGTVAFSFTPEHVGEFRITITYAGNEMTDSPRTFDIYDPQQCQLITPIQSEYSIGQPVTLQVSSANAGKGTLSATLAAPVTDQPLSSSTPSPHETPFPHHDTSSSFLATEKSSASVDLPATFCEPSLHQLSFTPHQTGEHLLTIYWNDMLIPASPVCINACCTVRGRGVEKAFEGLESDFDIVVPNELSLATADCSSLAVQITHQNGAHDGVSSNIKLLKDDGKYRKYRYVTYII